MAKDGPNWDGLLKWSLSHVDGSRPTRELSEEDRKWFIEAMQSQTMDVVKRMKEITQVMQTPQQVLESQGVTTEDLEDMLEELQEHVESIDMANDLHSIGGLVPLLEYLKNPEASIRAKAADVVSTIVQNNPQSQKLVMEAKGLESLHSNFASDPDTNARTKALGAISSLIRHNKPGITAFRLANGYSSLRDALVTDNVKFQRKALNLIHYLLQENELDRKIVTELDFPRVILHLASSEDPDIREAALRSLVELVKAKEDANTGNLEKNGNLNQFLQDAKLKQLLEERIEGISMMSEEDLRAAQEERHLVDTLWRLSFNKSSPLGDKGLLVRPGEDAPPPDVASKHFQPPMRALAANRSDGSSSDKKQEKPLLLGSGQSRGPNSHG